MQHVTREVSERKWAVCERRPEGAGGRAPPAERGDGVQAVPLALFIRPTFYLSFKIMALMSVFRSPEHARPIVS